MPDVLERSELPSLWGAIDLDLRHGTPEVLACAITKVSRTERTKLAERLEELLVSEEYLRSEETRVTGAKALILLLPSSLPHLERLLARRHGSRTGELHFSLFCFLDAVHRMRLENAVCSRVEGLVGDYLKSVRSSEGQAPWMAGDLLGDHWPPERAVPILCEAALHGRYAVGREGGVHGLSHALERSDKATQWKIVAVLQEVSRADRSKRVRGYAELVLGNLRGV